MEEFRYNRICDAMKEQGLKAVIASSLENVYYASGYYSTSKKMVSSVKMFAVVTPSRSKPVVICPISELPSVLEKDIAVEDVVAYGRFCFGFTDGKKDSDAVKTAMEKAESDAVTALVKTIENLRLDISELALDYTGLDGDFLQQVLNKLSCTGIKDALGVFQIARMIKDEDEIECLRKAAHIAEESTLYTFSWLHEGMTEEDAYRIYTIHVMEMGAVPNFAVFTFGNRGAYSDTSAEPKKLEPGEMIRADVGCSIKGYQADMSRTAVLGEPSAEIIRVFNAIRQGELAAIEIAKPGVPFSKLYETAMEVTHSSGAPEFARTHCGHSLGLCISEPPNIRPDCDKELEKNMVICVETPYYKLGWGGVQVEDTLLITDSGHELLTKTASELVIIEN